MRILIFHGYLLRGTGSNIYNANLVRTLAELGHEVHLLCQDRDYEPPEGVTVHIPDIGRVLPVYVADEYEGFEAKPFAELTDAELEHYIDANVEAVRAVPDPRRGAREPPRDGPGDPGSCAGGRGPIRGEDPRQRARVHGAAAPRALPPVRPRGDPRRQRGAGGLEPHRRVALRGAGGRAVAARAHPPRAARRGRAHLPPPRARPRADRGAAGRRLGRRAGHRRRAAHARPVERPDRELRRQADRLEGRGPAARGLAARGRPRSGRAPAGGRVRHLPRRARRLRRRAAARRRGGSEGDRRARPRARGRAGRRAEIPERVPRHGRRGLARAPPRRRPSASTSRAGSSTTTCPTCCPRWRRR